MSNDPKKRDRKNPFEDTEMDGLGKYMKRNRDAVRAERIQQTDQRIAEFAAQPKTLEWAKKALVFCDREEASGKDIAEDSVGVQDLPRIRAEAEEIIADAKREEEERARKAAEAKAEAERKAAEAKAEAARRAAEDARKAAEAKAEAQRKAAEAKAEAARRAAEAKAEAARRAAEAKAEAERKAEEARLAAARKAEEDRKAAIAAKEAQIRDTDALIEQLATAPRSRFWCDEVATAEKKIKELSAEVKLKLKNLPKLDDLVQEATAVHEAVEIDTRIVELKRSNSHTPAWANKVINVGRDINDENRPYIKEIAIFDKYLAEAQKTLRQPQIKLVKQALTHLESASVATQLERMRSSYDDTTDSVLDKIDYDMGEYIDNFASRWQAIGQKLETEERRRAAEEAEERRREAEEKREREKREKEEKRRRDAEEAAERRRREAEEAAERRRLEAKAAEERRKREEEERKRAAEETARKRREAEERVRREEARRKAARRKKQLKVTAIVLGIVIAIAVLVLSIAFLPGARHWIINILIAVAFTGLILLMRTATEAAIWLHLAISICLTIACIPMLCFTGVVFIYAFGFALTIFLSSAAMLLYQSAEDDWNDSETSGYYCGYLFSLFGGALFVIALGLLFSDVVTAIVIGAGFAALYTLLTLAFAATKEYGYNDTLPMMMQFFDVAILILAFVFIWLSMELSIIALGLAIAVFVRALISWICSEEAIKGWTIYLAGVVLIAGVLTLLFMHELIDIGREPWDIQDGVVVGYYGEDETVIVPEEWEGVPVTAIGEGAFDHYRPRKNMKIVVLHDDIERIEASAFEDCKNLREVNIPKKVTTIASHTFDDCENLCKVVFHDNVKKIEASAFYDCVSLNEIVLPRNLEEIGASAFNYAPLAGKVVMYDKVKVISGNAFATSNTVTNIFYHGTRKQWEGIEKDDSWLSHWAWNEDCYKLTIHDGPCDCVKTND